MIIHKTETYWDMDFGSEKETSAFFRSYFMDKHTNLYTGTKQKSKRQDLEPIETIYYSLPLAKQFVVNGLIQDLLSDAKKGHYIGLYLDEFLAKNELNYPLLAAYIARYMELSVLHEEEFSQNNIDELKIKSRIQKLLQSVKPQKKDTVLEIIADFFSVSIDVLISGRGKIYSVDLEKLKEVVDSKGMDPDKFVEELLQINMLDDFDKSDIEKYQKVLNRSPKAFTQCASEVLGIEPEEILIEEDCWVELEKYPLSKFYNLLTEKNKKVVKHVIENLAIRELKPEK